MTEAGDLYSSNIALCVFNAFLAYSATALNSVTIYAMTKTSSLPKPLKTLLLSLAVSDLGVGLISQPFYIAVLVMRLESNFGNNPTYKATYKAFLVPVNLFYYPSFLGVTALTLDRFLAIRLHIRYNELVTHKRVAYVIYGTIEAVCLITTAGLYCKIIRPYDATQIKFTPCKYNKKHRMVKWQMLQG